MHCQLIQVKKVLKIFPLRLSLLNNVNGVWFSMTVCLAVLLQQLHVERDYKVLIHQEIETIH